MKIWISEEALKGEKDQLLWPGALFGLKYLQKLDHAIGFDAGGLTPEQELLLENEHIASNFDDRKEADLYIFANSSTVLTAEKGDEIVCESDDWLKLSHLLCFPDRKAERRRSTSETDVEVSLNLDGTGESDISTGLGFLDHMLDQVAKHGLIDLRITCKGDLEVDEHHTIEDVAITLGEAISAALGEKAGIHRYGFVLPMDESKTETVIDLSGRPYFKFNGDFKREKVGEFPTEMVEHFFYSLAMNLKATIHIRVNGSNDHHKIEACFKGFARCLRAAVTRSERQYNILPSTKDQL